MPVPAVDMLAEMIRLKAVYGSLNTALVAIYVHVNGSENISNISRGLGLSRDAVRRALQDLSDSDS